MPELLELLVLKGCIVTLDAVGCQKEVAEKIRKGEADYILALKRNHTTAHNEVASYLDAAAHEGWNWINYAEEKEAKSHGRTEKRRCWQSGRKGWKDIKSITLVESEHTKTGGDTSAERRFF